MWMFLVLPFELIYVFKNIFKNILVSISKFAVVVLRRHFNKCLIISTGMGFEFAVPQNEEIKMKINVGPDL